VEAQRIRGQWRVTIQPAEGQADEHAPRV
jgi:hypothetical protein